MKKPARSNSFNNDRESLSVICPSVNEMKKEILHHINLDFSLRKRIIANVGAPVQAKQLVQQSVFVFNDPSIIMLRSIKLPGPTMCSLPLSGQVFPRLIASHGKDLYLRRKTERFIGGKKQRISIAREHYCETHLFC